MAKADISRRRSAKLRSELIAAIRSRHSLQIKLEQPASPLCPWAAAAREQTMRQFRFWSSPISNALTVETSPLRLTRLEARTRQRCASPTSSFRYRVIRRRQRQLEQLLCAAAAGNWEMHDQLFSEQRLLAAEAFSELAKRIGLNVDEFDSCLKTHKSSPESARDIADGTAIGTTPRRPSSLTGRCLSGRNLPKRFAIWSNWSFAGRIRLRR